MGVIWENAIELKPEMRMFIVYRGIICPNKWIWNFFSEGKYVQRKIILVNSNLFGCFFVASRKNIYEPRKWLQLALQFSFWLNIHNSYAAHTFFNAVR